MILGPVKSFYMLVSESVHKQYEPCNVNLCLLKRGGLIVRCTDAPHLESSFSDIANGVLLKK